MPRRAHGLMYETIGLIIINKFLLYRIEIQFAAQTQGNFGQIDKRTGTMPVLFIQREFAAFANGLVKIGYLLLRFRESHELLLQIRYVRFEPGIELAVRAFDKRYMVFPG